MVFCSSEFSVWSFLLMFFISLLNFLLRPRVGFLISSYNVSVFSCSSLSICGTITVTLSGSFWVSASSGRVACSPSGAVFPAPPSPPWPPRHLCLKKPSVLQTLRRTSVRGDRHVQTGARGTCRDPGSRAVGRQCGSVVARTPERRVRHRGPQLDSCAILGEHCWGVSPMP